MEVRYWYLLYMIIITHDLVNGQTCTLQTNVFTLTQEKIDEIVDIIKPYVPVLPNDTYLETVIEEYDAGATSEDLNLSLPELIAKNGYPVEEHNVTTSDGYILTVFRIPGNGSAVFIMHGLHMNAAAWVTTGKDRSLGYLLADAGFDVWLGNARGTTYGKQHTTLSADCVEFWNFSWHEIGSIDVPDTIDYILENTGKETVQYIGYSQGTTSFFVMASVKPEYNDKIEVMISLASAAYARNSNGIFARLLDLVTPIATDFDDTFGHYEILRRGVVLNDLFDAYCGTPVTAAVFCNTIVMIAGGFDLPQLNASYLPLVYAHIPDGCSSKQYLHYGQLVQSGEFRLYDYGLIENSEIYGSVTPPNYPISEITAPVVIFYGDNDQLSDVADVMILANELPNLIELYNVPYPLFGHADYVLANDVKTLVYDKIMTYLNV